jgi:ABC-type amino acid transport substrate-binding protein
MPSTRHSSGLSRHLRFTCLLSLALVQGLVGAQTSAPASAPATGPRCTQPLRAVFVDIDLGPYLPGQGSAFADNPGHFVRWIESEAARLGCAVTLTRLPPARLLPALASGEADIGVGLAPTPAREKAWVFPRDGQQRIDARRALFESRINLYVLQDNASSLGWDGQRFSTPVTVGGAKDSAPLALVQQRGWPTATVLNTPQALRMLRADRFQALVAPDILMTTAVLEAAPAVVALKPPLTTKAYFAPVSPALWQRDPALVRSLWRGLCRSGRAATGQVSQVAACG